MSESLSVVELDVMLETGTCCRTRMWCTPLCHGLHVVAVVVAALAEGLSLLWDARSMLRVWRMRVSCRVMMT